MTYIPIHFTKTEKKNQVHRYGVFKKSLYEIAVDLQNVHVAYNIEITIT